MTRFMKEYNGMLGEFWKQEAEKELAKVKAELDSGKITIDKNGIARNSIGRVLMSDMLEKLALVTDQVNVEATTQARDEEVARELKAYRESKKAYTEDELNEMRAAFGPGAKVRDIFTGEEITL